LEKTTPKLILIKYDILKNLELEAKNKTAPQETNTKEELLELIQTINLNEYQNKNNKTEKNVEIEETETELDPLDILSDLKGDENTVVVGAKDFTEEMKAFETNEIGVIRDEDEDTSMDNSFYTNSMSFNKKDFQDFEELEKENNIAIKILIGVVIIAIIVGIVIFLNEFLKLNWF